MIDPGDQINTLAGFNHLYSEIRGYIHYAMSHMDDPEALRRTLLAIEKITRQGTEIANCLRMLLPQTKPILKPHSLCELVDDTVREFQNSKSGQDISVVRKFSAAPWVEADSELLKQVLYAILQVFTHIISRDSSGNITVTIEEKSGSAFVRFISTGRVINISVIDDVLMQDICNKTAADRDTGIAFLGILGARKLIELHQGNFSLDNDNDTGTTVSIGLPLLDKRAALRSDLTDTAPAEIKSEYDISVLIADDDFSIRDLLKTILGSMGITRIDMASNGEEAVQKALSKNHDLIFMDVSMPVLSGIDAFKKIRAEKPAARIIFITGLYQEDEIIEKLYEENVYGYIRKPFDIAEIKKIIARAN